MQSGRWLGYATISALIGIGGLLGLTLVELDHVQERLIVQGRQLRALGEATDRLAASGVRSVTTGGAEPSSSTDEPTKGESHYSIYSACG